MTNEHIFWIDPRVATKFPEIKVGMVIIRNVRVSSQHPELEKLKPEILASVRQNLQDKVLMELPRVKAFRNIYRKFGVKPGSRRPSAESLLRRALNTEKELYRVNTVVDAYNLSSMEFQLPMAAYDLDRVTLPLSLRFAHDGEQHRAIGQKDPDTLNAGELIYADQQIVLCRDFNYRDAEETKVTTETRNLIVFVDGCDEVNAVELSEALGAVAERICLFNGGSVQNTDIYPIS